MALSFPTTITGSAQTGFTGHTYTLSLDSAPDQYGLQRAVTGLGGTQPGVDVHSISRPFTLTWVRPKKLKALMYNPQTQSVLKDAGLNNWLLLVRKGMTVAVNQPPKVGHVKVDIGVPVGADINDPGSVRAMIAVAIGELQAISAGIGDTGVTGLAWGS